MNILMTRDNPSENSTGGFMSINGEKECYTLEPARTSENPPIPAGVYPISLRSSPKFQKLAQEALDETAREFFKKYCNRMPHIDYKPGSITMIHPGNAPKDTKDCVLVGVTRGQDVIGSSRVAFAALFSKLEAAESAGEPISIEIQDNL